MAVGGTAKAHAATPEAARFVGWDRALRPGFEPVIVAVKPLRGTVAENALRYGTGGLHVDACRLERGDADAGQEMMIDPRGGYPANVAMDDVTAQALDEMSGPVTKSGEGASAFFYVAKASSSERDKGLEDLPPLTAGERSDREDGAAGINGYAGTRGEGGRNPHPTVKPTALMRWLVRLASPPGAHAPDLADRPVILDPFTGSGSTGVAAMAEGVRFIGCELMPEYAEVARRRLQHAYALPKDDPEAPVRREEARGQRALF